MASIGSTSVSVELGVSTPLIVYLPLTLAATEYNFTFPANTREYWFVNWGNSLVEYGYVSAGNTMPLHMKEAREKTKLTLTGSLTVYFQSVKPSGLVKIEYWV